MAATCALRSSSITCFIIVFSSILIFCGRSRTEDIRKSAVRGYGNECSFEGKTVVRLIISHRLMVRHIGIVLLKLKRRKKYLHTRLRIYSNSVATLQLKYLLSCGDIETNPGPTGDGNSRPTCQKQKESFKHKLSCVSFNSRSIVNKRLELSSLLVSKSYELVAITETFLDSTINSSEIFSDSFNVQRRDRSRHGGGVLLAVHQGLCCIRRTDFETDCEILWCEIIVMKPYSRVLVGVFYRPPSSDIDYLKELERSLSLIERSGNNLNILLLGDFNLPQIVWFTPSPTCPDSLSSTFCAIIADYFLNQLVLQPTREQNILDLVFITAPELVKDLEICQPVGGSDHCSIEFTLKLKFQRPERSCRFVYNYRAADWLGLREDFCNLQWDCSYLMETVDDVWDAWKILFFQAVERNVPSKQLKPQRNAPWLNAELLKLIRKKRRLWKQAKSSGDPAKWVKYKRLSNSVKDHLNKAYWNYVNELTASLKTNPKKFWSFVKARTGKRSVASCIEYEGKRAYSPLDKANPFNSFFQSVFIVDSEASDFQNLSQLTDHVIGDLSCSADEVAKLLQSIDVNKASGPDNIPPRILKECAMELALPLTNFFNFTLSRGNIPTDWKVANVVPIFKSGKNNLADNYRPISLTSVVVKILERLIHKHIMKYLTDFQLLNDNQHGFRPSRSCVTQLLQLVHEWLQALDKLGSVDAVFLDFAKAFDKVSHAHLLYKLECYGIKGQILNWLRDFLTSRKQRVVIEGQASDWLSVTSGVPQGSILGPLLFLAYINDLPYSVTCNSDLFADDTVLHRFIENGSDCDLLQEDLTSASEWCKSWLVTLKTEKCEVLHITRKRDPIRCQYSLNNILLPEVDQHKHLGLWLESSLSWDYHINSICAKANKVLGLIKRTFGSSKKTGIKTAFKALIIPILEYACPVWNPYLVKHTKAIEAIQRRASRLICGPDKEYPERLLELKWDSLELRRKYLSLVQMYKIIFGYYDINCHHYLDIIGITRTRSNH